MLNLEKFPRGIRLFEHPALDLLSRMHPLLLLLVWGPVAGGMIAWGLAHGVSGLEALGLVPAGLVLWLLTEYSIHRWMFHFRPRSTVGKRLYYFVHEHHHRYHERDRLVAPLLMSVPVFLGLFAGLALAVGLPLGFPRMWTVFGGLMLGYLGYDFVHLYVHVAKPRTRVGRFLQRCHNEHHSSHPDCWYSVSCPWLDYVFGTHARRDREVALGDEATRPWQQEELPRLVREHEEARRAGAR